MNKENYSVRKAELKDLRKIIELYAEQDELSQARENLSPELDQAYLKAFERINQDSNQYLMLLELGQEIIGTCQLTLMPSLTLKGALRLNIEGVRVDEKYRGQKIGEWMMEQVFQYGKDHGVSFVQLTTNKQRLKAKNFYEKLGFVASHEGMKLDLTLKTIDIPSLDKYQDLIDTSRELAKSTGFSEKDLSEAIKAVRKNS